MYSWARQNIFEVSNLHPGILMSIGVFIVGNGGGTLQWTSIPSRRMYILLVAAIQKQEMSGRLMDRSLGVDTLCF